MKKSIDYFKTLKEMSAAVSSAYTQMMQTNDFNKDIIVFSGLKWELVNNLFDEFVAPVDRNDLYCLSYSLNEQIQAVSKLSRFFDLFNYSIFPFYSSFEQVLISQVELFELFSVKKPYSKIIKYIYDCKAMLNGLNSSIVLSLKKSMTIEEQPMLRCVVLGAFSDLFKAVDKTFSEAERVVINNN